MFGSLIDYWYYTGDDSYNAITTQALLHQAGPGADFMPQNQTKTLGNDDQAFWALAAMSAAEANFPNPPVDQPQWLALVQAVFNSQVPRWDDSSCGGGLRWQIFSFNRGFDYKNSISNGCFFNIAARLGRYTGNSTYTDWAMKSWNWVRTSGLMEKREDGLHIYDGSDVKLNCTDQNHIEWSYNAGVYLYGASIMYNIVSIILYHKRTRRTLTLRNQSAEADPNSAETAMWKANVDQIMLGINIFFKNNIMFEVACESNGRCDVDQRSFKAYLSRWMAASTKVAPWTHDTIMPLMATSASAAVGTCILGADGNQCGLRWTEGPVNDGTWLGVGEQMCALEVVQSNLIDYVDGPLTNKTGGTSVGDPLAGSHSNDNPDQFDTIKTADKAGATILTLLVLSMLFAGAWWMGVKG
jgi:mannan endo-1,6-alpha-mannosidase